MRKMGPKRAKIGPKKGHFGGHFGGQKWPKNGQKWPKWPILRQMAPKMTQMPVTCQCYLGEPGVNQSLIRRQVTGGVPGPVRARAGRPGRSRARFRAWAGPVRARAGPWRARPGPAGGWDGQTDSGHGRHQDV